MTGSDWQLLLDGGFAEYVWVGSRHMLTGYDHLLFLAGVIFVLTGFRDILKFITVFTLGHSITLTGATYAGIQVNEHLVDAVIGFSVFYKGFENLGGFKRIFGRNSPNLLFMVFVFGLIHGLGLSSRLQSFALGEEDLLKKILSFNLGVELGQVVALVPIVLIIGLWRKYRSYEAFFKAMNVYLLIAGVLLTMYQLFQYLEIPWG